MKNLPLIDVLVPSRLSLVEQRRMALRLEKKLNAAWNDAHTLDKIAGISSTNDILTSIESALSAMARLKSANNIA